GDNENATLTNILGGVNANGAYEGVHALIGAGSIVGQTPRILIAPGFTHQRPSSVNIEENGTGATANPVAAELIGIAERLRAIVVLDAPNTTDEAALSAAKDFDSKRAIIVDPFVKVNRDGKIVEQPASAAVAGVIAKTDFTHGFWHSPSNKVINGIVGTARPIDFSIGDRSSRANLLNEQNITTIIRENGYRLWGNRTLSSDTKFAFLSVVRTADMINDAILRG
ncbi:phage tail sheath family protein, partial [Bartonella sp. AA86SXKL]